MPPVAAKLVTIIAAFDCYDSVRNALKKRGIKGFSVGRSEGEGVHGQQTEGFSSSANYVFTVVTTPELAADLMAWVERALIRKNFPAIAYAADVVAVLGAPLGQKEPQAPPMSGRSRQKS
jgi:hypothetical protein